MKLQQLIKDIASKHREDGFTINAPASETKIQLLEDKIGFKLPSDFRELYLTCNGFGTTDDIFNISSIDDIMEYASSYGKGWYYFSEYMIYSDMWGLRFTEKQEYEIFNGSYPDTSMGSSLVAFLQHFLNGGVFESNGLYEWLDKLEVEQGRSPHN